MLREENEQICEQLRLAREELVAADIKLENMRQKAIEVSKQAQDSIAVERRKRIDAEEDARIHTEAGFLNFYLFMQIWNYSCKNFDLANYFYFRKQEL